MYRIFRIFLFVVALGFSWMNAFASVLPFSDVAQTDGYYNDLVTLYQRGIIGDSPTGKFFPDALMNRDEFVSIVVGVGCKRCLTPSFDDIAHYNTLPFVDFERKNINFYCVSYAKEQGIVEGYVVDGNAAASCQDGTSYTQTPFCANNKISRIEAAAVLLRQAGLWNNTLNTTRFEHRESIADVEDGWYGYAQKALQSGIIKKDTSNKIRPNEYITKREFVSMASKIFAVNLCALKSGAGNDGNRTNTSQNNSSNGSNASGNNSATSAASTFSSEIRVLDKKELTCTKTSPETTFPDPKETTYTFAARTESLGNLEYTWEFVRIQDGRKLTASGACLPTWSLDGEGTWLVRLTIRDKDTGKTSTATSTIEVHGNTAIPNNQLRGLSVTATANILSANIPETVRFTGFGTG